MSNAQSSSSPVRKLVLAPALMTPRARSLIAVAVPMLLAAVIYLGSLKGGFVWDDYVLADGTGIGGGKSLAACFRTAFLDHFYRPLVSVSFLIDRLLWRNNPAAYHWVNIVLHALGTGVIVVLVRETFRSWGIGAIAGVLFAVHPVHVGAVAWIGGRTDALGCLWTGLFLLGLVAGAQRKGQGRALCLAGGCVAYALAVFTKEQSLALLPLVPFVFACFRTPRGITLPGEGWYVLAPYLVVAALYLAMGAFLGMPGPAPMGATLGEQLQRFFLATVAYTELLLLPNQRAMHALSLEPWNRATPWSVAGGVLIAIGTVVLFVVWMRRDRRLAWMLTATILALLPVSNLLPMPFLLYAPYRAAVASIGVVAILARLLSGLRAELQGFRAAPAAIALACVASWYSMQTVQGIPTFESEPRLFSTVVAYDPDSVVAHYMLAKLASDAGDNRTAAQHLSEVLTYVYGSNRWQDPQHALQLFEQDRGVRMRALQNQGQRGDPKPYLASLFRHLGFTRMQMGDTDGALAALETALAWEPRSPELHHGLGWCYAQKAQYARAATHLVQAVSAEPTVERRQLLAQVFERLGRYQEAAEQWQAAVTMAARGSSSQ